MQILKNLICYKIQQCNLFLNYKILIKFYKIAQQKNETFPLITLNGEILKIVIIKKQVKDFQY